MPLPGDGEWRGEAPPESAEANDPAPGSEDETYRERAELANLLRESEEVRGALRRSEDRYRQLFETCPEGLYVSTLERRFMAVNPAMVSLFGYDSEREMLDLDPQYL